jgi:diguanylate cyclase (GGDEF)-like protein
MHSATIYESHERVCVARDSTAAWLVLVMVGAGMFGAGALLGLIAEPPRLVVPTPIGLLVGLPSILALLVACVALARRAQRAEAAARVLAHDASTDPLTGLANRRALAERLDSEVARSRRNFAPLACLVVDIDHFKSVNDRFGHLVGDEVLVEVAERLRSSLRREDVVGRWGGEEFLVILPSTNRFGALRVAEKIREAVAASPFEVATARISLTVSLGLGDAGAGVISQAETLVAVADRALYAAKAGGRNRVAA